MKQASLVWYTDDGKLRQRALNEDLDDKKQTGKCSCCKKTKKIAARAICRECKKPENFCSDCLEARKDQSIWFWTVMKHRACVKQAVASSTPINVYE